MPEAKPADDLPPIVDRINVALVAEAAQALVRLQRDTGLKKVDIVNRGLILYEFIETELRSGGRLIIRDEKGNDQLVKLL
ncbi:hypothetical protein ACIBH1_45565 [Nonomuraea sp. NPDC050663]|uniref:hypothetical protein n=1 Tax=Nonomuraea sp. NPDC050663 TaxID=3364370 RepID=UPI0037951DC0